MTSLLHTAINNLHIQQSHPAPGASPSRSPRPPQRNLNDSAQDGADDDVEEGDFYSGEDDETDGGDSVVDLDTRPGTPMSMSRSASAAGRQRGTTGTGSRSVERASAVAGSSKDPIRNLPSSILIRIFIRLDVKSLAQCDKVCKRWHKSTTLNYVWFLHVRTLALPLAPTSRAGLRDLPASSILSSSTPGHLIDPSDPDSFDPYDKPSLLSTPLKTALPKDISTPQWSKRESKTAWKDEFKKMAVRKEGDNDPGEAFRVDVERLSGYTTPLYDSPGGSGANTPNGTPGKSKKEMRAIYKSMDGRKSKVKGRGDLGGTARGHKDIGGMGEDQYSAPW